MIVGYLPGYAEEMKVLSKLLTEVLEETPNAIENSCGGNLFDMLVLFDTRKLEEVHCGFKTHLWFDMTEEVFLSHFKYFYDLLQNFEVIGVASEDIKEFVTKRFPAFEDQIVVVGTAKDYVGDDYTDAPNWHRMEYFLRKTFLNL